MITKIIPCPITGLEREIHHHVLTLHRKLKIVAIECEVHFLTENGTDDNRSFFVPLVASNEYKVYSTGEKAGELVSLADLEIAEYTGNYDNMIGQYDFFEYAAKHVAMIIDDEIDKYIQRAAIAGKFDAKQNTI